MLIITTKTYASINPDTGREEDVDTSAAKLNQAASYLRIDNGARVINCFNILALDTNLHTVLTHQ